MVSTVNLHPYNKDALIGVVDSVFIFSIIWAVGGATDAKGRRVFDQVFRTVLAGGVPEGLEDFIIKEHVTPMADPIPDDNGSMLFDYCLDFETCKVRRCRLTSG